MAFTRPVLELEALNAKFKGVLTGYDVTKVTICITKMAITCSPMICLITLLWYQMEKSGTTYSSKKNWKMLGTIANHTGSVALSEDAAFVSAVIFISLNLTIVKLKIKTSFHACWNKNQTEKTKEVKINFDFGWFIPFSHHTASFSKGANHRYPVS